MFLNHERHEVHERRNTTMRNIRIIGMEVADARVKCARHNVWLTIRGHNDVPPAPEGWQTLSVVADGGVIVRRLDG
jgi:hypothetical protein